MLCADFNVVVEKLDKACPTNIKIYGDLWGQKGTLGRSVPDPIPDPDPPDPRVFGPPGSRSGSISQRYGSGSFYHQAKKVRKTLILTVL